MTTPDLPWPPELADLDTERVQLVVVQARRAAAPSGSLSVSEDIADELRGIVGEALAHLAERTPVPWSAQAALEDDEYWHVRREQLDDSAPALFGLERREHPDVSPEWLRDRAGVVYAIAVGPQPAPGEADHRALFVRKRNPVVNLNRKVAAFWDEALQKVDYPLVALDRGVDFVLLPGRGVLAMNPLAFEQLFREAPELLARAPQAARAVASAARMTSEAEAILVEAASRLARVRRRILAVVESGHLATVPPKAMRAELARWGFNPAVHYKNNRLSFDAEEVQLIMKVLNEDLLVAGLTGTHYEVERKTPLA